VTRQAGLGVERLPTICHVLHHLDVGGAELLAKHFARHSAGEFRTVFLCLDAVGRLGRELQAEGSTVESVKRRPGFDFGCARRIAKFLRREGVRLIHAHQYTPFFYSALARWCGYTAPIVFTEHGRDDPDFRRWKRVWANRLLLRRADQVVAVGDAVRAALIHHEGFPAERVRVIRNGVDASRFDVCRPARQAVRAELGIAIDEVAVVHVARLNRLKDHGTALQAIAQTLRSGAAMRYFIVGEGEEEPTIRQHIDRLGIGARVHLLGLRQDVPRLLEGMDVFLLSSITEGIPLALLEAMMAQLPCVATNVGGVAEVIATPQAGLLAAAAQPEAIAEHLTRLVGSATMRQEMGLAGRRRAIELFGDDAMRRQYTEIYRIGSKRR
jgi:L-malate glycosyltransferase